MVSAERSFSRPSTSVDRLLGKNDTLYGMRPSQIASMVGTKLNSLSQAGKVVTGVVALPDYHTFGSDGGVKDILFLTRQALLTDAPPVQWQTTTMSGRDRGTYDGVKTQAIEDDLSAKIAELEAEGKTIGHVVALDDYHNFAVGQGVGGFDGLKDFVICYY